MLPVKWYGTSRVFAAPKKQTPSNLKTLLHIDTAGNSPPDHSPCYAAHTAPGHSFHLAAAAHIDLLLLPRCQYKCQACLASIELLHADTYNPNPRYLPKSAWYPAIPFSTAAIPSGTVPPLLLNQMQAVLLPVPERLFRQP